MATELRGKLMAIGWDTQKARVLWLQGMVDPIALPEPLFEAAWKALGDPVLVTVSDTGVAESLRVKRT